MEVGGVGPISGHEHAVEISEEQKCIRRRANNAEGDGSEGTLEGSFARDQPPTPSATPIAFSLTK